MRGKVARFGSDPTSPTQTDNCGPPQTLAELPGATHRHPTPPRPTPSHPIPPTPRHPTPPHTPQLHTPNTPKHTQTRLNTVGPGGKRLVRGPGGTRPVPAAQRRPRRHARLHAAGAGCTHAHRRPQLCARSQPRRVRSRLDCLTDQPTSWRPAVHPNPSRGYASAPHPIPPDPIRPHPIPPHPIPPHPTPSVPTQPRAGQAQLTRAKTNRTEPILTISGQLYATLAANTCIPLCAVRGLPCRRRGVEARRRGVEDPLR